MSLLYFLFCFIHKGMVRGEFDNEADNLGLDCDDETESLSEFREQTVIQNPLDCSTSTGDLSENVDQATDTLDFVNVGDCSTSTKGLLECMDQSTETLDLLCDVLDKATDTFDLVPGVVDAVSILNMMV